MTLASTESSEVSVVASVGLEGLLVSRRACSMRSRSSPPSELPEQKPASRSLEVGEPGDKEKKRKEGKLVKSKHGFFELNC